MLFKQRHKSCVDSNLAAGNIASGTTIFGILGTAPVVTGAGTGSAGAAGQILSGYYDWGSNGAVIQGSVASQTSDLSSTAQSAAAGVNKFTVPAGYYSGSVNVTATDAQVAALNASLVTRKH